MEKKMNKYVFVTIGAPACGKSSFYHKIVGDNDWGMGDDPVYISSDAIRAQINGSEDSQENPVGIFTAIRFDANKALSEGRSVYIDATHARKEWREYAIKIAKKHGVPCIALYFDVPLSTLIKRDRQRKRHVGFRVLLKYFFRTEVPSISEGFDTIFRIDKDGSYDEVEY